MEKQWNDIKIIHSGVSGFEDFIRKSASEPFSDEAVGFLDALSKTLNRDPEILEFPDVAAFAFFCRISNIRRLMEKFTDLNEIRQGRGTLFHIAPSNVPVNFAYSMVCGILSGNNNIVRLPSENFRQAEIICRAIALLAENDQYGETAARNMLVRYERKSEATAYLSSLCDVRLIWGGNDTIAEIRKSPLPPRSFDVTFADRYSFCMINADEFAGEQNPDKITRGFYNDTYLFDQNACTSPHLVVWTGLDENVKKSQKVFWENMYQVVKMKNYKLQAKTAVDKLVTFYEQAICSDKLSKENSPDNLIFRIIPEKLPAEIDEYRCMGGYFNEVHVNSLSDLLPIINRRYQTVAYYGYTKNELAQLIKTLRPHGIDRMVPIGRTSDFSLIWDGFDLIRTLSRRIEIL